jgi:hypothetical protein
MQIVLDYITGKVDSEVFKEAWYASPEIGLWLECLIDLKSPLPPEWENAPLGMYRLMIHKHYDGSLLKCIESSEAFKADYGTKLPKWLEIGWYFDLIASIIVIAFPEITPTTIYENERDFYRNTVGDYIGGVAVEECIANTIQQYPPSMPKTKRKKEAKAAIRALFHIEGSKYPQWIQEPAWPMGKYSPMAYVSRKRNGELVQFLFQDVDTHEIKVVEQLY